MGSRSPKPRTAQRQNCETCPFYSSKGIIVLETGDRLLCPAKAADLLQEATDREASDEFIAQVARTRAHDDAVKTISDQFQPSIDACQQYVWARGLEAVGPLDVETESAHRTLGIATEIIDKTSTLLRNIGHTVISISTAVD